MSQDKFHRFVAAVLCVAGVITYPGDTGWLAAQSQNANGSGQSVALVLPANVPSGASFSGSVADPKDVDDYQNIPGLSVVFIPVAQPAPSANKENGAAASLSGSVDEVDLGDGKRQPITGPLVASLATNATSLLVSLYSKQQPDTPVAQAVVPVRAVPEKPPVAQRPPRPFDYSIPSCTTPGGVQVITGPTSGNAKEMHVAVNDTPARVLAATPNATFFALDKSLDGGRPLTVLFQPNPGQAPVTLHTGTTSVSLAAKRNMTTHEQEELAITVKIPPQVNWAYGNPSPLLVDTQKAWEHKDVAQPKAQDGGAFLVTVENLSDAIQLEHNNFVSFAIHQNEVENGAVTRNFRIKAKHRGVFTIVAHVYPYVAESVGREARQPAAGVPVSDNTDRNDKSNDTEIPHANDPIKKPDRSAAQANGSQPATDDSKANDQSFALFWAWLHSALSKDDLFQTLIASDPDLSSKVKSWEEAKKSKADADKALDNAMKHQKTLEATAEKARNARDFAKDTAALSAERADLYAKDEGTSPKKKEETKAQAQRDAAALDGTEKNFQQADAAAQRGAKQLKEVSKAAQKAQEALEEAASHVDPELQKVVEQMEKNAPAQERVDESQLQRNPR